jgi:hypothetical protein
VHVCSVRLSNWEVSSCVAAGSSNYGLRSSARALVKRLWNTYNANAPHLCQPRHQAPHLWLLEPARHAATGAVIRRRRRSTRRQQRSSTGLGRHSGLYGIQLGLGGEKTRVSLPPRFWKRRPSVRRDVMVAESSAQPDFKICGEFFKSFLCAARRMLSPCVLILSPAGSRPFDVCLFRCAGGT